MEIDITSSKNGKVEVYFKPNLYVQYHWIVKKDELDMFCETKGIYYIENSFNSQMLNNVLRHYYGFVLGGI